MKNIANKMDVELDRFQGQFDEIRQNFAALSTDEKSSASKSNVIGRNLCELRAENRYRQLKDKDGKGFQTWQKFCEKGCEFSRIYADKLMKCTGIQERLEVSGVTTIKQSVANLYALHVAEKNNHIDIVTVWKEATGSTPDVFPARSAVLKAINPRALGSAKTNPRAKFIKELYGLDLTDSEKTTLDGIIAKWNAAPKEAAKVKEA